MSETPKVSIIMPSLNVQPYIRQCVDSVLNQTLNDIEILCIDAGSTDGTLEILQEFAQKDHRIRLLHSDRRSYGYQVNLGIKNSVAEYIGIVETDDYIVPEMFEILYSAAVNAGRPDVVKSGNYVIWPAPDGGERITEDYPIDLPSGSVFQLSDHYELLIGHPNIWTCIYKRAFIKKNNIHVVEAPGGGWVDVPFLYQTLCEAGQICWVNKPLYYYRRNNPTASTRLKDCSIPMARINDCKDYLEKRFPSNRILEKQLFYRALYYRKVIGKYSTCTEENLQEAEKTFRRFRPEVRAWVILGKRFRTIKRSLQSLLTGKNELTDRT